MIASFYDKGLKGLLNNASLRIDNNSYKLIKRPVELNELTCTCEAFTENINPTFLVISDARGRYIYGSLAGVPVLNSDNKTEINGTDIKSVLSCDVILDKQDFASVNEAINYIFVQWDNQTGGVFGSRSLFSNEYTECELVYDETIGTIKIDNDGLKPVYPNGVYNALEEMQSLMRYYKLYLDTEIDIANRVVRFIIGRTMAEPVNVKLWEYGVKNYGKWVADVNDCQGYLMSTDDNDRNHYYTEETSTGAKSIRWILTASGDITTNTSKRDIYPIKRKIVTSTESMTDANMLALEILLENKYNEDIELPASIIQPSFETLFKVYVNRGDTKPYKDLPCGELQYDASGLVKFKIGWRYTGVNFI